MKMEKSKKFFVSQKNKFTGKKKSTSKLYIKIVDFLICSGIIKSITKTSYLAKIKDVKLLSFF